MAWDLVTVNHVADEVLVTLGIAFMIVRQFTWRSAELRRMLLLPLVIVGAGLVYLVIEMCTGFHWVTGDWVILGELALVTLTGSLMGYVTDFRTYRERLQYKLTAVGVLLWLVFVGIRIGSFYLAAALGANLGGAVGMILLSFGVNRVAAILVVRRRVCALEALA